MELVRLSMMGSVNKNAIGLLLAAVEGGFKSWSETGKNG